MNRPAEASGVAAALALLIAHVVGVTDSSTITALAVVVGFVPAAVTWAVITFRKHSSPAPPPPPAPVPPPPAPPQP